MEATVYSICVNEERGKLKHEIPAGKFIENKGISGDGHQGDWGRQVTCLNYGSLVRSNAEHQLNMGPGDFAENVLIDGMDQLNLQPGDNVVMTGGITNGVSGNTNLIKVETV